MVTMGKGELKLYMCTVIDSLKGAAYDRFCELFLTACGVVDEDGNLAKEYADSPYWAGGKASLAATDSYRAHKREFECGEGDVECVVPIAMAQAVASAGLAGDARLVTDGKRVTFDMGVYRITSRCIEGTFPPVERIFQDSGVTGKASFDQADMRGALKRSEAAASDGSQSVKVSLGGSAVDFEVQGDKVAFTDEIEAECDGSDEVRFKPRLLLDAVSSMPDGDDSPTFEVQGARGPALFKRDGYVAAVMPMKG